MWKSIRKVVRCRLKLGDCTKQLSIEDFPPVASLKSHSYI